MPALSHMWHKPSPWEWHLFPAAFLAFKHLETLALDVLDDHTFDMRASTHAHTLVERCMASCPMLRFVAITSTLVLMSGSTESQISFTRDPGPDSKVEINGLQRLKESTWRDI